MHQPRQQGYARRKVVKFDIFAWIVGQATTCAQAINGRHADYCRIIRVGGTAAADILYLQA